MKRRIPVDIQFLMESILAEDPDRFLMDKDQVEKMRSLGAEVPKDTGADLYFDEGDAIPFYIDNGNVVVFRELGTHGVMEAYIKDMVMFLDEEPYASTDWKTKFSEKKYNGVIGVNLEGVDDGGHGLYFYGLKDNSHDGLKKYIEDNRERLSDLEIRGYGGEHSGELSGRVWKDYNVISFWNSKSKLNKHLPLIFDFIKVIGGNPTKYVYEFIDSDTMYSYSTLNKAVGKSEKRTPEEIMALLRKQHLDAKSKRELWNTLSSEEKNDIKKKYARSFDFPAQADAALPALEGHIKLKDLLKENPDKVDLTGGSGGDMKIARYQDSDAVAFFAFPSFGAYYEGGTHSDIINVLYNVYTELKLKISKYGDGLEIGKSLEDSYAFTKDYMMKSDVHVTDFDGMVKDMQSGPLKDFFDNENIHSDDDPGGFRTKSGGLSGRLWSRKKIVSFWNVREDVISKWNMIVQFFTQSTGKFGSLYEYKVDWLERDIRVMPMTPADEITSATGSEENQMDFLEKLSADAPPISPEELKELQKILHKLSPEKKKEALIKLGYKNKKYEEKAAIADKLGMTVAEFNSIMNVNEGEAL